jgi:hypothetical protein
VLTSKVVQENINSLLDSLSRSELDEAKRKLAALSTEVKSEKDRGSLLAAAGIYASMTKAKEGTMQNWDPEKVDRAAKSITLSQMADEFDTGYAETLVSYSRLRQNSQQPVTYTEVSK